MLAFLLQKLLIPIIKKIILHLSAEGDVSDKDIEAQLEKTHSVGKCYKVILTCVFFLH